MKHLTPTEAYEALQREPRALLVDCRTELEFFYVGHPIGAVNIEWHVAPDFHVNPQFVAQVQQEAGDPARPLVLICRSGKRTLDAGAALEAAGFTDVSNVLEGFEGDLDENFHRGTLGGWRKAGLPWEQM
ncbi:MAG: rhodanese-like domain-containing protein [Burkholderiaceae bacterium]|jgi:rhodanese-related sulfurtransferase|nr:rhodanese-like domain-containing protein [Burkholderiaceae bacterium]